MRIFIIGDRLQVTPSNDLKRILSLMGHEPEVFFPPADLVDIIQGESFNPIFDNIDKADLVIGLDNLASSAGIFYGYAIGRDKRLLTEHKYDIPNVERVVGVANIIEWVMSNNQE
jgi:hypothetical protein